MVFICSLCHHTLIFILASPSLAGGIQLSSATYSLLMSSDAPTGPEEWEATGGVEVKGKGIMETYLFAGSTELNAIPPVEPNGISAEESPAVVPGSCEFPLPQDSLDPPPPPSCDEWVKASSSMTAVSPFSSSAHCARPLSRRHSSRDLHNSKLGELDNDAWQKYRHLSAANGSNTTGPNNIAPISEMSESNQVEPGGPLYGKPPPGKRGSFVRSADFCPLIPRQGSAGAVRSMVSSGSMGRIRFSQQASDKIDDSYPVSSKSAASPGSFVSVSAAQVNLEDFGDNKEPHRGGR